MAKYVLPELTYDYGALEPHISGKIMELHHKKHHAAYVTNANNALDALQEVRTKGDFSRVAPLERVLAFNLSGHVMHSLFWRNLAPKAGGMPEGDLAKAIEADFGNFDAFKKQFTEAANTVLGSGWAALVWEPLAQRLIVTQIYDHQSNVAQGGTPIMVLDAWEHAWYLQYENRKAEFFAAAWNLWNWKDIAERYQAAKKNNLVLPGAAT